MKELNAEDPGNADLVRKYGIHSYPHVVYADASGKKVFETTYFMSPEEFVQSIGQFTAL